MSSYTIRMTQTISAVLFLSILTPPIISDQVLYKGAYEAHTTTPIDVELVQRTGKDLNSDFRSQPALDKISSAMVNPLENKLFVDLFKKRNATRRLLLSDVQKTINRETMFNKIRYVKRRSIEALNIVNANGTSFAYFWTLDEIYQYLNMLEKKYPELVEVMDYGMTHENRPIKVITISSNGTVDKSRPVVLIDGGMHAREWASHMAVVYLIHQLVECSEENMDLLDNTDWVIVPVANPDGYEYTQIERLWRKNRAPINGSSCIGTDLNRNFPFQWKDYGNKCSIGFAGLGPASELETQAIINLMTNYASATKVYLAVHSCGDFILYPYGYDHVDAPNKEKLHALGEKAAEAVRTVHGSNYSVGSAASLLYPANGSDDYIYGQLGVEYAYTLELSCSESSSGSIFVISVAEMQRINKEAFEMFKVFGKFAGEQMISSMPKITAIKQLRLFITVAITWAELDLEARGTSMKFTVSLALSVLAVLVSTEQVSYRNYKVYKIELESREQHTQLRRWEDVDGVDFWDRAGRRVMISPELQNHFEKFLEANKITHELIIDDVEATIDAERKYDQEYRKTKSASGRSTVDFDHYWRTQEIYDYLDELAASYPSLVSVEVIGHSYENREIKSITIASTNGQVSGSKPVIFIDGGVHAREWAAIMSVVYLIHELVEHSSEYPDMLTNDWVIIPVANPDGYEFSHTSNRMWRKNRFPGSILCTGVDLNRNFAYQWASGSNLCSDTYPGTGPTSESETQALVSLMERYRSSLTLYLAVHTYGDMILYPYGYAWPFIPVDNAAAHITLGQNARAAVLAVGGPTYVVGNSAEILYTAFGASDDYALGLAGFTYGFTLELTGGGSQGFDLPATQLQSVAHATFQIFRSMANDI
ncbi:uncharacterized protein LOC134209422 [Armigeres subalbatus]|uniref:uncharacterized protein LOC134209422 n=1 Tax=Armigeres subalbatus TaxID=124917 RepID=UPI002ED1522C